MLVTGDWINHSRPSHVKMTMALGRSMGDVLLSVNEPRSALSLVVHFAQAWPVHAKHMYILGRCIADALSY